MSRRDQLLRVRADAILKSGGKRILRLIQDAALRGKRAFALFEISLPNCGCGAFHGVFGMGTSAFSLESGVGSSSSKKPLVR